MVERFNVEKKKMKMCSFLFEIAVACKILSQRFQSFLIMKIYMFRFFFFFFEGVGGWGGHQ